MVLVLPPTPTRRVERLMGTVVGVDVREPVDPGVLDAVFAWLHWVETTFSVFRPDSEISRLARGELDPDEASPEVREVLVRCDALRAQTDGDFEHRPAGQPDRPLDPSGLVKGWSIDHAGLLLRAAGVRSFCVNAGGDVLCAGQPASGRPWRVGIRHPEDPGAVAAVLEVGDAAVATSGRYERGDHVWARPDTVGTEPAGTGLLSVTVVGRELGTTDALATAALAAGTVPPRWWGAVAGHELLVIAGDHRVQYTNGLDAVVVSPRPTRDDRPWSAAAPGGRMSDEREEAPWRSS